MDRKIRVAAATSLLALTAAACAPNPYYTGTGYNNYGTNTTTNRGAVNRNAVTHTHCGRTHSHALPAEGLAHHHGDGCVAGSGGAATTTPNYNYGYTAPVTTPIPQQPAINYGYTAPATTPYVDYSISGSNTGSSSSSYYEYTAPKTSTAPASTYRSPTPTSAPTSAPTTFNPNSSEYVVQKGDTVFQVMRTTGAYWKDIIRLNNLEAPNYPITPGQRLRLK
ncbi:LysM peptidoglycan-binding domain-containing protein [Thiothrix subterranea]|uniref:LysM peptidoglycan-binding domain-containing protein n=1 Tax=Thiothrix subterranea TaxID=2735563 RepID=UPI00192B1B33|nr:LysM peptidoglycan-binding domain-containing protein [Thiothrix subterranea]QQZ28519.1 LysM peptidoglycan-binding domain-containing protein [Thiothrix subterranea]